MVKTLEKLFFISASNKHSLKKYFIRHTLIRPYLTGALLDWTFLKLDQLTRHSTPSSALVTKWSKASIMYILNFNSLLKITESRQFHVYLTKFSISMCMRAVWLVFACRTRKLTILNFALRQCAYRSLCSDCTKYRPISLRWAHMWTCRNCPACDQKCYNAAYFLHLYSMVLSGPEGR